MSDSSLQFIELPKIKYPLVNLFYKQVYKKGIASKNERVFILQKNSIVCSAKLKPVDGYLLLTGVACSPAESGQGHATRLIKTLLAEQDQPVYCFPYAHLFNFYRRIGFTPLALADAPLAIAQRFQRYQLSQDLRLMVYK